jgi:putative flippase GtrA
MLGKLLNLTGEAITFVKVNDFKTVTKAVISRDVHPLMQFIKYVVCGVVAFSTHQVIALTLGQTIFRDGEFDLTLRTTPSPVVAGGHEVILTKRDSGGPNVTISHRGEQFTYIPNSVASTRIDQLRNLTEPCWGRPDSISPKEKSAILNLVQEITAFDRKAVREKHSLINNSLAFLFAGALAYALNVMFVFTPGRHSKWMEITLFVLVSLVSYVGGIAAVKLVFNVFGEGPLLSIIANFGFAVTSAMVNFVCRKFIIFAK